MCFNIYVIMFMYSIQYISYCRAHCALNQSTRKKTMPLHQDVIICVYNMQVNQRYVYNCVVYIVYLYRYYIVHIVCSISQGARRRGSKM